MTERLRLHSADFSSAAANLAAAVLNETADFDLLSRNDDRETFWAARIRVLRKTDARRCVEAPAAEYGILWCTPCCILFSLFPPARARRPWRVVNGYPRIRSTGPCIRDERYCETMRVSRLRAWGQKFPDPRDRPELTLWTGSG